MVGRIDSFRKGMLCFELRKKKRYDYEQGSQVLRSDAIDTDNIGRLSIYLVWRKEKDFLDTVANWAF